MSLTVLRRSGTGASPAYGPDKNLMDTPSRLVGMLIVRVAELIGIVALVVAAWAVVHTARESLRRRRR